MRRRLVIKFIVFLALGALATAALTWTGAFACRERVLNHRRTAELLKQHHEDSNTHESGTLWWPNAAFDSLVGDVVVETFASGAHRASCYDGFPFRCLSRVERINTPAPFWGFSKNTGKIEDGLPFDAQLNLCQGRDRFVMQQITVALPLRPLWPGFAINTLFYAFICWLLWSAPFALRRFMRRRRNLCVQCKYDLRGHEHERCPECGLALQRS